VSPRVTGLVRISALERAAVVALACQLAGRRTAGRFPGSARVRGRHGDRTGCRHREPGEDPFQAGLRT